MYGLGYAPKGTGTRTQLDPPGEVVTPAKVVTGWADWLISKGPQVMGTVNTRYPLSIRQHERVGRRIQDLYIEGCGEKPTVLVAVQENPSREGFHSHPLVCGTDALLTVRRKDVWAELMAELRLQHGGGQHWTPSGGGFDLQLQRKLVGPCGIEECCIGGLYRQPATAADAYNAARVRLEPVRTPEDVLGYATRYGVRMGDGLIVLTGDLWRADLMQK